MSTSERIYCTYFDRAYEPRARLMVQSLRAAGETAPVLAVCFDDASMRRVADWPLPDVTPITMVDVEARFPQLITVKPERTRAEYFFTCTPWVTQFALDQVDEGGWATYLDADLYFPASPSPLYDELDGFSVGIVPHRFSDQRADLRRFGTYNVGWVSFRSDDHGRALLQWWGDRCLEWCRDEPVDGLFADQGYLDSFPTVGRSVHVIAHPGANLAPWNLNSHHIAQSSEGSVVVDGQPLLFFHMHGLSREGRRYVCRLSRYGTSANDIVRNVLLTPYVEQLAAAERDSPEMRPAERGVARGVRALASRQRARLFPRPLDQGDLEWTT